MFHEIGFAAEDAIPRVSFEGEDGTDVAQSLVGDGEPMRQARSVVQCRMGGKPVPVNRRRPQTNHGQRARFLSAHDMQTRIQIPNRFGRRCRNTYYHRSELGTSVKQEKKEKKKVNTQKNGMHSYDGDDTNEPGVARIYIKIRKCGQIIDKREGKFNCETNLLLDVSVLGRPKLDMEKKNKHNNSKNKIDNT